MRISSAQKLMMKGCMYEQNMEMKKMILTVMIIITIVDGVKIMRRGIDVCGQLVCDGVRPHCIVDGTEFVCVGADHFGTIVDSLDINLEMDRSGYYFHSAAKVEIYHAFDGRWCEGGMVSEDNEVYAVERNEMSDGRVVLVDDRGSRFLLKFFGMEVGEIATPSTTQSTTEQKTAVTSRGTEPSTTRFKSTTTSSTSTETTPSTVMTEPSTTRFRSTTTSSTSTATRMTETTPSTMTLTRRITTTERISSMTTMRTGQVTEGTTVTRRGQTVTPALTTTDKYTVHTTVSVAPDDDDDDNVKFPVKLIVSSVCGCVLVIALLVLGIIYRCKRMGSGRLRPLPMNNAIYKTTVHPGRDIPDHSKIDLSVYDDTKF